MVWVKSPWAWFGATFLLGASLNAVESPPANCQGTETFRFTVQGSLNGGSTWSSESLNICAFQGSTVDIAVRTLMTVTSGQTQGWSFSLKHDPSALQYYGGNLTISGVTTSGTGTATVQDGGAPDSNNTAIRAGFNGYTQGIVIDSASQFTLPPVTGFVTSRACYRLTVPTSPGYYQATLNFTNDIGNPPIRSVVTQIGRSYLSCAQNLTLYIQATSYYCGSYPTCTIGGGGSSPMSAQDGEEPVADGGPAGAGPQGGGAPGPYGTDFKRGDANQDNLLDISDAVTSLNFIFQNAQIGCKDSVDTNDDEYTDVSWLFGGGDAIPHPTVCGPDVTGPATSQLDCQSYIPCGSPQIDSDSDGLTDNYELIIGTNPGNPDTDGDRFKDGHEVLATGVPGCGFPQGALNIHAIGADPLMRDIFVEIDWMEAVDHNDRPRDGGLAWIFLLRRKIQAEECLKQRNESCPVACRKRAGQRLSQISI